MVSFHTQAFSRSQTIFAGNLALSRALGDFEFKKNYNLPAEKQVITADPEITVHERTDEDEFVVIACDGQSIHSMVYRLVFISAPGIWDCLSSQQVINFVRYQVSEGKSLQEIGENICEHCLAPDTSSGAGIGYTFPLLLSVSKVSPDAIT